MWMVSSRLPVEASSLPFGEYATEQTDVAWLSVPQSGFPVVTSHKRMLPKRSVASTFPSGENHSDPHGRSESDLICFPVLRSYRTIPSAVPRANVLPSGEIASSLRNNE